MANLYGNVGGGAGGGGAAAGGGGGGGGGGGSGNNNQNNKEPEYPVVFHPRSYDYGGFQSLMNPRGIYTDPRGSYDPQGSYGGMDPRSSYGGLDPRSSYGGGSYYEPESGYQPKDNYYSDYRPSQSYPANFRTHDSNNQPITNPNYMKSIQY